MAKLVHLIFIQVRVQIVKYLLQVSHLQPNKTSAVC